MRPNFLYLFEMIGYAQHGPIKIGITDNLKRREGELTGGRFPSLVGYFRFVNRAAAFACEQKICARFPDKFQGREYLNATSAEVLKVAKEVIGETATFIPAIE